MGGVRKKKKQQQAPPEKGAASGGGCDDDGDEFWDKFELPEYDGDEESDIGVSEWVSKLETFFDFTGKPDGQRLVYATNLLTAGAHAKWRSLLSQISCGKISPVKSWEDFKAHLGRMTNGEGRNEILEADWVLKQGSSCVSDYTKKFFGSRKMGRYIAGLNPRAADYVNRRSPKDFQEAANLAYEWEYQMEAAKASEADMDESEGEDGKAEFEDGGTSSSSSGGGYENNNNNNDIPWLKGKVNGRDITMVQNKTSSANYVSKRLVKRLELGTHGSTPFKLDEPSTDADMIARNVALELEDGFVVTMDFCVVDLARYDMILGLPFFEYFNNLGFHFDHILVDDHRLGLYRGQPA